MIHVGQHHKGFFHVGIKGFDMETGAFLCGKGIDLPADHIHGGGDVESGFRHCPLKQHMFQKMGNTHFVAPFAA
ncbi:hypothetical protein SDC9_115068 [bioreactor metagenome]|uniref:Uncharacterized protein n=1 Tax=bioreactor metagenome TaxID=1076179 RepID=A0A645BSC7_9ZZZZ